jgi:aldose 1-epimerase
MINRAQQGLILGLMILMLSSWPSGLMAASTETEPFGVTSRGQNVTRIILTNDQGMRVALINYGATLTAIDVPDRGGNIANVVLSLPDMPAYERTQRRWGGIIGRYAGRIGQARFELDAKRYNLEPGRNGVTLHGGSNGYDKRVWAYRTSRRIDSVAATFTLLSPDGDQGFPGAVRLEVTYRLMRNTNQLRLTYRATTTAPTVVNFTNHAFFNLAGAGTGVISGHELTILADHFAPTNDIKIPTGQLLPVAQTPLDFRTPMTIGRAMDLNNPLLAPSKGFDHSYSFLAATGRMRPIARLKHPASGRIMEIETTQPGLQFNSGNAFDSTETGSEGVAYPVYSGLALETQHLPDSPNQPNFPSTRINPNNAFRAETVFLFSTD